MIVIDRIRICDKSDLSKWWDLNNDLSRFCWWDMFTDDEQSWTLSCGNCRNCGWIRKMSCIFKLNLICRVLFHVKTIIQFEQWLQKMFWWQAMFTNDDPFWMRSGNCRNYWWRWVSFFDIIFRVLLHVKGITQLITEYVLMIGNVYQWWSILELLWKLQTLGLD